MRIDHISVVIIASNADSTINECLEALSSFQEVIIYLNNSQDSTKEISSKFDNVKIIDGEFTGFGDTRNTAAKYATNPWVLSLDSDEILNNEAIKEIISQDYSNDNIVYMITLLNYFLGKETIKKDYKERLYNKNHTQFNTNQVHEKLEIQKDTKKIQLSKGIKHLNITNINQTLTKMIKYTDLGSKNHKMCFFIIVIIKSFFAFFQTYIIKLYIKDGWRGYVIAKTNANRRFYKYLKQYINCKVKK